MSGESCIKLTGYKYSAVPVNPPKAPPRNLADPLQAQRELERNLGEENKSSEKAVRWGRGAHTCESSVAVDVHSE